ncbi:MAG: hypothetical protein J6Y57_06010 [Lachnospiraceae bacterium]|nr:hypothetical protein [Lachnospiraceae bacterium]
MFLKFASQDERKEYGGTCFIELQFCNLPESTPAEKILDHDELWRNDSLYVYGDSPLYAEYKNIFGKGIYSNMSEGLFDYYGITYYKPELIDGIVDRAQEYKPDGYEILIDWLKDAKQYNGFYILGM